MSVVLHRPCSSDRDDIESRRQVRPDNTKARDDRVLRRAVFSTVRRSVGLSQLASRDVTADSLRSWCLARPSAVEEFPFGPETSVFKVGGKMFALAALEARPLTVSLKCEPALAEALRAEHSAIRPGYHLNKRHWITVTLDDSLPDELVTGLLEDSYELVVAGLPNRKR
jgi:predicted DNA-binding protein (MmcQ/YjbR family)